MINKSNFDSGQQKVALETRRKLMSNQFNVVENNGKFIVTKNGEPINRSSLVVTKFDTKQDAEKYISILKSLVRN
jgi:hypothetical protein